MKKSNKLFSILLGITLLASNFVMSVSAAIPALDTVNSTVADDYSFNTPAAISNQGTASNQLVGNASFSTDDYTASLYGKKSWDYALGLTSAKDGLNFYSKGINPFSYHKPVGAVMYHGYEFAMPGTASVGATHSYSIKDIIVESATSNAVSGFICVPESKSTSQSRDFLKFVKGETENKVVLFGEFEATLNWENDKWYSVDIYITKGNGTQTKSYMTIYVDGMPLTLKDGKTLDGVKTTTQKFLIDANSATPEVEGFAGYYFGGSQIRAFDLGENDVVYVDNVAQYFYASTNEAYLNNNRKTYTLRTPLDLDFSTSVDLSNHPVTDVYYSGSGTGLAIENEMLSHVSAGQMPRIWLMGNKNSGQRPVVGGIDRVVFSTDIKSNVSVAYELRTSNVTTETKFIKNTNTYGTGQPYVISANTREMVSKTETDTWTDKWVNAEFIYDVNNDAVNVKVFARPQYTTPRVVGLKGGTLGWINLYNPTSTPVYYDNLKLIHQNYYPVIKSLEYDIASTDYEVATTVSQITATLDGRIADTTDANISKIKIVSEKGMVIPCDVSYDETLNTLTFTGISGLEGTRVYNIIFPENLTLTDGISMGESYQYSFKTGAVPFRAKSVQLTKKNADGVMETHNYGYINDKSDIGAQVKMVNTSGVEQKYTAILAIYDANGVLENLDIVPVTVGAQEEESTFDFTGLNLGNNASGDIIKVYLWDNIEDMNPITEGFHLWTNTNSYGGGGTSFQER